MNLFQDLEAVFQKVNSKFFKNELPVPEFVWNTRLSVTAGRFRPGRQRWMQTPKWAPRIEIASYLKDLKNSDAAIWDTMAHEMIHYWLWIKKKPYGHTKEFNQIRIKLGVSRYNPVPKDRPFKHLYRCPVCEVEIKTKRAIGQAACKNCCITYNFGLFDSRFKLEKVEKSFPLSSRDIG